MCRPKNRQSMSRFELVSIFSHGSLTIVLKMADIDGFILAGGESSRMGQDKADLMLGKETLVERAAGSMIAVTRRTFVVGDLVGEQRYDLVIVRDRFKIGGGPHSRGAIIGLHAAFLPELDASIQFAIGVLKSVFSVSCSTGF